MRYNLDLRYKESKGMTYLIQTTDGFMGYIAIYRFDGEHYIRKLAHENCKSRFFGYILTPREFKELLAEVPKDGVTMIGVLQ